MISIDVETAISLSTVVLYRRVSTDQQVKSEYKNQLEVIKSAYPNFSIVNSTILSEKEPMSGRASPEKRMASGLGKCLKMLKRHPESILLVSDADRIARRADIFELIQRQGLGHRVFEAASGMSVNDIIATGKHHKIQAKTETDARLSTAVAAAVDTLDERERFIVQSRLMADKDDELSLAEIGRRLGVSRERARQLEARAKRKLRSHISETNRAEGDWLELDNAA